MDQEQEALSEVDAVNAAAGAPEEVRRAAGKAPAKLVHLAEAQVVAQGKRRRLKS